jgi:hypothetical protein
LLSPAAFLPAFALAAQAARGNDSGNNPLAFGWRWLAAAGLFHARRP